MREGSVTYSPEICDEFCARISEGQSVLSICKDPAMPGRNAFYRWLREHPEFMRQYNIAVEARADAFIEEIIDIADDGSNDWMAQNEPENPGYKFNGEHMQRSRLRVDTRKWIAAKMKPKKYGDKMDLSGAVTLKHANEFTDDELAHIAAGGSAVALGAANRSEIAAALHGVHDAELEAGEDTPDYSGAV